MGQGLKQAIDAAGGVTALAKILNITTQAISQWERVPVGQCLRIHKHLGIPLPKLRSDIYPTKNYSAGA